MAEMNDLCLLKLSLQRALIGTITVNVRAVTAGIAKEEVTVSVYYYAPPSEEETEEFAVIATEVIADFPAPYRIQTHFIIGESVPLKMLDFWAYMRKAPSGSSD